MPRSQNRPRRQRNPANHIRNPQNKTMTTRGPGGKFGGTAAQIADRYEAMAEDAGRTGDRVRSMDCRQHAEHYRRIATAAAAESKAASMS